MGKRDIDRRRIQELCEKTGLRSFVASLPEGYDAELDPAGKRLPKSVVQKILLVRALAHNPSLLIMEEPWLGIEEEYSQKIQELILGAGDTTVIVATTDEAFSRKCNQVIQLEVQKQ